MTDEKNQDKENTHHEIIDKTDTTNDYQEKDILEDEGFNKSLAEATAIANKRAEERAALIDDIKSDNSAADKNNNTSNKGTQTVEVSDFDMPFWSMVVFMVKWAIASIPAILILMVLFAIFGGFFFAIFN
jgi:hypothetical protein